ncbi:hypothetical protein RFI_29343 [Reticulomyxa filosa]|uniref:Protein OS9-like domain-containing protein n=1 Tax=Reticulomyxa filosa TaxID=46433 RepID=X6M1L5_RETFI|nr:hypothetical protein RFI_29343 [Reticulomyxa filosa]|eukprot:ETO08048.1 hypothetical protein RFI_29343 [Reticulomyxa filosa]
MQSMQINILISFFVLMYSFQNNLFSIQKRLTLRSANISDIESFNLKHSKHSMFSKQFVFEKKKKIFLRRTQDELLDKPTKGTQIKCYGYHAPHDYWSYEVYLFSKVTQFNGNSGHKKSAVHLGEFQSSLLAFPVDKFVHIDDLKPTCNVLRPTNTFFTSSMPIAMPSDPPLSLCYVRLKTIIYLIIIIITMIIIIIFLFCQHILFVNEPQKLTYHIAIAIKELCQYQAWLVNTFQIPKVQQQVMPATSSKLPENSGSEHQSTHSSDAASTATVDVAELLKPLLKLPCLNYAQGWWTVEFCYGQHVRQVHFEPVVENQSFVFQTSTININKKDEMGWDGMGMIIPINSSVLSIRKDELSPENTYVEMQEKVTILESYREDELCHYIAEVTTPRVCTHPDFVVPKSPSHEIVCFPLQKSHFVATKKSAYSTTAALNAVKLATVLQRQAQQDTITKIIHRVIQDDQAAWTNTPQVVTSQTDTSHFHNPDTTVPTSKQEL